MMTDEYFVEMHTLNLLTVACTFHVQPRFNVQRGIRQEKTFLKFISVHN
jgi:hypothetical protein